MRCRFILLLSISSVYISSHLPFDESPLSCKTHTLKSHSSRQILLQTAGAPMKTKRTLPSWAGKSLAQHGTDKMPCYIPLADDISHSGEAQVSPAGYCVGLSALNWSTLSLGPSPERHRHAPLWSSPAQGAAPAAPHLPSRGICPNASTFKCTCVMSQPCSFILQVVCVNRSTKAHSLSLLTTSVFTILEWCHAYRPRREKELEGPHAG